MADEVEVTQEQIEESQAEMPPIDEKIDEKEKKEENGLSAEERDRIHCQSYGIRA